MIILIPIISSYDVVKLDGLAQLDILSELIGKVISSWLLLRVIISS